MTQRRRIIIWCLLSLIILPGCDNGEELEDSTLVLMLGMDLSPDRHLTVYTASPVLSEEAQKPVQNIKVQASTLGQAGNAMETSSPDFNGGKIQQVLVGKRLLLHPEWFHLLDRFYRDSKWAVSANIIAVDGSVSSIFQHPPQEQPMLPMYLTKLIDSAGQKNMTVQTTLQDLHRQMFEKGITPVLTEIRKAGKKLVVTGSVLLNEHGKYVASLSTQQNAYLILLKGKNTGQLSFDLPMPMQKTDSLLQTNRTHFYVQHPKRTVKVGYKNGRFHFCIHLDLPIFFTERPFPINVEENEKYLQKQIARQMNQQMKKLVQKLQKDKVDPIGLGIYARAYQYKAWKHVRDHWSKAFAEADIRLSSTVDIRETGIVK